jgi:hypothetical protein
MEPAHRPKAVGRRARHRRLEEGNRVVDSIDELDMYEAEKRLKLYREYENALSSFPYYVETELRAYLADKVDVEPVHAEGGTYFKVTLTDAWIYEAERLQRFVPEVIIYEVGPVHVQRLRGINQ